MTLAKPLALGAIMGLMMLWMLHEALTGGGLVLIGFVAMHVAVVLLAAATAVFAARLSPRALAWLGRVHRPRLPHLLAMLTGMAGSAGLVHLALHGMA